jgi:peptidoglycan lytic transglycosylase G
VSDISFDDDPEPTRSRRPGAGCLVGLVVLVLVAAIGAFAYHQGVDLLKRALSRPPELTCSRAHGRSATVTVKTGDNWSDAAKILCKRGIISDYSNFIDAANGTTKSLIPGSYRLRGSLAPTAALNILSNANRRLLTRVTIPEGYRAKEALTLIADKTRFTAAQVQRAFISLQKSALPPYANGDAEGYLFPATYDVEPGMTAGDLLKMTVDQFDAYAQTAKLPSRSHALGYSPGQVVTVASLVQAEARRSQDMPKVAAVIYNRLKAGMALQLDSTLHYAVDSRGEITTSRSLRSLNSPYNSYTHTGLPPTPIDSPGADALDAALHPADASYLYFVTVNLRTGETRFATTFAEHLHNVSLYKHYCLTSDAC